MSFLVSIKIKTWTLACVDCVCDMIPARSVCCPIDAFSLAAPSLSLCLCEFGTSQSIVQ